MNNDKAKTHKTETPEQNKAASGKKGAIRQPDAEIRMLDAVISRGWTLTS